MTQTACLKYSAFGVWLLEMHAPLSPPRIINIYPAINMNTDSILIMRLRGAATLKAHSR